MSGMTGRPPVVTAVLSAPWGPLHAAASATGIVAVAMLSTREAFLAEVRRTWDLDAAALPQGREHLDRLAADLERYFHDGNGGLDTPIDLNVASDWDRLVLTGVSAIAPGSVDTYGGVAQRIGRKGAAQAVGGAVGRNPIAILIPCHRVVAAGGRIGG